MQPMWSVSAVTPICTRILLQDLGSSVADRVVDLGSGTGLFTRVWIGKTREVIGVEPNPDMRDVARAASPSEEKGTVIRYLEGHSAAIPLLDGSADIVACSQSFHWMDPIATLAEVNRILRPGGLFATVDCDWPPVITPMAEKIYRETSAKIKALERELGTSEPIKRWSKDKHLANIKESGYFHYVREICMHQMEMGDAERLVGLLLSQGSVETLLKTGLSEEKLGLEDMRIKCRRILGDSPSQWYFSYRVRIGVKG
jgi:ubiquinone/menaquinone biosynthesis C-methylase UbiE